MPTTAKIVADSISESGVRLTTLVLEYPRIIHSEFMTHRMFSRNASSNRAIPVEKQIERVKEDGFIPSQFGVNKKGMQADSVLNELDTEYAHMQWNAAKVEAIARASQLAKLGVHKQLANRLLEPFSHIQVVVTATEWDNFFLQRLDKNAQPEIQELAKVMKEAMESSTPKLLKTDEWHLPFIDMEEDSRLVYNLWRSSDSIEHPFTNTPIVQILARLSVARCARVSYGLNERGWGDIEKDLALYDMLLTNNHWSPFEHQATTFTYPIEGKGYTWPDGITHQDREFNLWSGNFKGWVQNRQLIQQSK